MAETKKSMYNGGSAGVLYTDRRDFYVSPQVVKELWTDVAPFTTVISNRETRKVPDPIFKMFEHRNPWVKQKCLVNGTPTLDDDDNGDTVAVDGIVGLVDGPDNSWVGLIFEFWNTAETTKAGTAVVTAVSGSNLTMKTLSGAAFSPGNNAPMYVVGNAHGEGSSAPDAWADELQVVFNSSQIFKTPLQITGTLLAASLRGEASELSRLRAQKNQEHKMQKEKAFLFGQRDSGTDLGGSAYDAGNRSADIVETFADDGRTDANSNVIRTTYGMVSAMDKYGESGSYDYQNIFSVSEATYTYNSFVDDMEKVFQYVPEAGVKRAFCGSGALGYWSKMAGSEGMAGSSGWTVNLSDMRRDSLGFNYKVLETPHGILQLIPTPALRGPYNKYMLVVSEENLFHAQYRSPMYQTNIKTDNAFDGVKDQYFSDEGVGISLIESHHLFKVTD
jgi:hypothetical protein|tara:strand:- start:852 stop:2189 length:1338 start_codon:yes stop_codon:yes gene_type:complete